MTSFERTTASRVLHRIIATVGIERLARTLQVSKLELEPFATGARAMTFPQQRALAMAALTLSGEAPSLRRHAATFLGQLQAREAFLAGTTARHMYGPARTHWT